MGDDAELYWEMEHNPYFWDEVESCSRNICLTCRERNLKLYENSFGTNKYVQLFTEEFRKKFRIL